MKTFSVKILKIIEQKEAEDNDDEETVEASCTYCCFNVRLTLYGRYELWMYVVLTFCVSWV